MFTVVAIHKPLTDHLNSVKAEMEKLGVPEIKVVDCGDYYMALEGSHRIAAAAESGIVPELSIYGQDEIIDITIFDWYEPANWSEESYTAGEVAGELYSTQAVPYRFEDQ